MIRSIRVVRFSWSVYSTPRIFFKKKSRFIHVNVKYNKLGHISMDADDATIEKKSWFRENILGVPCLKNTVLTGISGSVFAGLGYFMFTSNVQKSYSFTKKSFFGAGILYWFFCRYKYTRAKAQATKVRKMLTSPDAPDFQKKLDLDLKKIRRVYGGQDS